VIGIEFFCQAILQKQFVPVNTFEKSSKFKKKGAPFQGHPLAWGYSFFTYTEMIKSNEII